MNGFFGPFFRIHGFTFILEFYPRGETEDDANNTTLYLSIAAIPNNVSCLVIKYDLLCIEKKVKFSAISRFLNGSSSKGWPNGKVTNADIQNLDTLTFKCIIRLIDVFDDNGRCITAQWIDSHNLLNSSRITKAIPFKQHKYEWPVKISTMSLMKIASNSQGFQSPIFLLGGMQWMLELFRMFCLLPSAIVSAPILFF